MGSSASDATAGSSARPPEKAHAALDGGVALDTKPRESQKQRLAMETKRMVTRRARRVSASTVLHCFRTR